MMNLSKIHFLLGTAFDAAACGEPWSSQDNGPCPVLVSDGGLCIELDHLQTRETVD